MYINTVKIRYLDKQRKTRYTQKISATFSTEATQYKTPKRRRRLSIRQSENSVVSGYFWGRKCQVWGGYSDVSELSSAGQRLAGFYVQLGNHTL